MPWDKLKSGVHALGQIKKCCWPHVSEFICLTTTYDKLKSVVDSLRPIKSAFNSDLRRVN